MTRHTLLANLAALLGSLLFGASVVATREAVSTVAPVNLAVLRFGQGGIILAIVLLLATPGVLRLNRRAAGQIALLGAIMFALFPLLFNGALQFTTASRGAVILATMPLGAAVLARATGQERLTRRQLLGVLLSVVGVIVVFAEGGIGPGENRRELLGNAMMVAASACGAVYGMLAKPVLSRLPAIVVTGGSMLAGAVLLAPIALASDLTGDISRLDARTALLVLFLGTGGGALAYWLIMFALARLTPSQAIAYINVNPLVATLLGALLLDETLSSRFLLGFGLVAAGLILANWPTADRSRPPADADQPSTSESLAPTLNQRGSTTP